MTTPATDAALDESDSTDEADDRARAEREVLIAALAAGSTDEEAATLAGCSARTVRRRRSEDPTFGREVSRRRAERVAALTGRLVELGDRSLDILAASLDEEDPRIRLRAAELILTTGSRLRRATEVDDQIEELRALADQLADAQSESTSEVSP